MLMHVCSMDIGSFRPHSERMHNSHKCIIYHLYIAIYSEWFMQERFLGLYAVEAYLTPAFAMNCKGCQTNGFCHVINFTLHLILMKCLYAPL